SLVSIITMVDLTKAYGQVSATYYDYFGPGIIVAAIYLLLGLPFVKFSRYAERKLAHQDRDEKRGTTQRNYYRASTRWH
ncbi:MAG: amino acid ABC transporter permease, partial [Synergistaceae bacterium]|nr:amino acid ABC transporter permease [Synergistaceae bacterium]